MSDVAENILARLDPAYTDGDEVLWVVTRAVAPKLQAAADAITGMGANFDPDSAPDAWLDWLLERIGWRVPATLTAYTKREILRHVGDWRRRYGRPGVIEEIVATYFRASSSATPLTVSVGVRGQTDGGYRVGRGYLGKARIWQRFSRNVLRIIVTSPGSLTYSSEIRRQLLALLEELVPPWMTFELIDP
jgi:hypothetical protein